MSNCNNNTNIGDTVKLVSDIKRDASLLHEVVHSNKNEMMVDTGPRKTLKGLTEYLEQVIAENGYKPPVEYSAGLNVSEAHFTVIHDGIVYAPRPDLLPFDTTESFDSEQWLTLQGLTSIRLGMEDGASLVGTEGGTQKSVNKILQGFDPAETFSGGAYKIVCSDDSLFKGVKFVMTQGGAHSGVITRLQRGNVQGGVVADSENRAWELWRTTLTQSISKAYVYKKPTLSNDWSAYQDVFLEIMNPIQNNNQLTLKALKFTSATKIGSSATFNVSVDSNCTASLTFLCTAGSPEAQTIYVNGFAQEVVNLKCATGRRLKTFNISVPAGDVEIKVVVETAASTLNVVGVNLTELNELSSQNLDVDEWAVYIKNQNYISAIGASDYAIMSATNKLYAGSFHGGETARSPAELKVGGKSYDMDKTTGVAIGRTVNLLQQTLINWESSGESIEMNTLLSFGDGSVSQQCQASKCNLVAANFFIGMTTTAPEFSTLMGSEYYDRAIEQNAQYNFGSAYQITQLHRSAGMTITTTLSKPKVLNNYLGGLSVSYNNKLYSKVYSGFLRQANYKMPPSFAWTFTRRYS